MTTIEAPEIGVATTIETDSLEDIPDMTAHLYRMESGVALCGLRCENDPHDKWHHTNSDVWIATPPGTICCPECGAPVCEVCVEKNS